MKRLTVYLKNQKKVEVDGKKKLFNVRSFHQITKDEAMRLLTTFEKKDVVNYELVNY